MKLLDEKSMSESEIDELAKTDEKKIIAELHKIMTRERTELDKVREKSSYHEIHGAAKLAKVLKDSIDSINEVLYEYSEHHCLNGIYIAQFLNVMFNMKLQELHNSLFWVLNNQENLVIITENDRPICVDEDKSFEKMLWEFSIFYNYVPEVDFSVDINKLDFRELMVEV